MSDFAATVAARNAATEKWTTEHIIEPFMLAFGAVTGLGVMWALISVAACMPLE